MTFFTSTVDEVIEYTDESPPTPTTYPPLHILGVTALPGYGYRIGCICGWRGVDARSGLPIDPIDAMAEQFMEHKRLSAQVARRTKKFRKPPQ